MIPLQDIYSQTESNISPTASRTDLIRMSDLIEDASDTVTEESMQRVLSIGYSVLTILLVVRVVFVILAIIIYIYAFCL